MPINITISNSLENLAAKFTYSLSNQDKHVFDKDLIVTQTEGIKKWLSLFVSSHSESGIFANFEFSNPNGFFDSLFKKLDSTYEDSYLQQGSMKWIIFDILSGDTFKSDTDFTEIFTYCGADRVKLLRLSDKIADLFDQYFIYREQMIISWNSDALWDDIFAGKYKDIEKWQFKIFKKVKEIVSTMRTNSTNKFKDRVELKAVLFEELKDSNSTIVKELKKIKRISFFGLSIITNYHYELIGRIAEIIDCDFYLLNPSGEFWYDLQDDKQILKKIAKGLPEVSVKSENDFLANYGRSGQEFYKILFTNEAAINNLNSDLFDEVFPSTLLGTVQDSIFNVYLDEALSKGSTEVPSLFDTPDTVDTLEWDDSLKISSCYTSYREVEVFYDYILSLFDKESSLKPSDILVLIPDIENYAPYIEAIFSQNSGDTYIPFSIADKSYKGGDNPFDVMSQIIELSRGVCEAESIMSIVENRYVADRYGFEDFDKIRDIIKSASIRWGIDKKQIEREGEFEFNKFNSWEFGLKRVIFGYAMQTETEIDSNIDEDMLPIDTVEGADALDGLRLYALVKDIKTFFDEVTRSRTLEDWKILFVRYFDTFIALPFEETNYKQDFEKLLIYYSGTSFEVSFNVVRDDILKLFADKKEEGGFYSGSITFCSMIPMRSIPHKVIAMLGMGENDFPGRRSTSTFDLMEHHKIPGDRAPKLSNRYLFLEGVVSAKEYLYLSYIGKSSKNSTELNPSPAIDDLISYVAEVLGQPDNEIKEQLITEYPLYGYGEKYRVGKLPTYIKDNDIYLNNDEPNTDSKQQSVHSDNEQINYLATVASLINFYKDSAKWYANVVLGIYFNEDEILLKGEECFDVDNLTNWKISNELLADKSTAIVTKHMQKFEADIPLGTYGELLVENSNTKIQNLKDTYFLLTRNKQCNNFGVNYRDIQGSVPLFDNLFVSFTVSKKPFKGLFEHYVNHLFLCANEFNGESLFIEQTGKQHRFTIIEPAAAKEQIDMLISFIEGNLNSPLPFDIDIAGKFINKPDRFRTLKSLNTELKYKREGFSPEYINKMLPDFTFDEESYEQFLDMCEMTLVEVKKISEEVL